MSSLSNIRFGKICRNSLLAHKIISLNEDAFSLLHTTSRGSSTIPFLASFRLPSTMAIDNVVLNIYDLLPGDQSHAASSSSRSSSLTSFFSGMLAPLGMGAYHTSIDVRGEISFCFMMPTSIR